MRRKLIENRLKVRIAKAIFFTLTSIVTSVSYITELRPQIVLTFGYYGCGVIDGLLIALSLIACILYFHKS